MLPNRKSATPSQENENEVAKEEVSPKQQLRESRKIAKKACKELLCFLSFLTVFTVVQVVGQTTETSLFAQHIRESFRPRLLDVVDDDTFYTYVRETFLPKAFYFEAPQPELIPDVRAFVDAVSVDRWFLATPSVNSIELPDNNLLVAMDQANHMLGAVRVRQYRVVAAENCLHGDLFSHFSTTCYRGFSASVAETKLAEPADATNGNVDAGKYGTPGASPPFSGSVATYTGNAFYVDFTALAAANAEIDSMGGRNYINTGTRAVLIDFTVFNSNLDQFGLTRISFEFGPSGIVAPAIRISVIRRNALGPFVLDSISNAIASIGDIVIVAFLIYYLVEETSEITALRWMYFRNGWNYMDWTNLILLALAYAYRIKIYLSFFDVEVGAQQLLDRTSFQDFQTEAEDVATVRMLNSFNSVLLWIKCVKYVEFMPYIQFLYVTVHAIMDKYFSFLFLFLVLMCGFVHAFTIGFGSLLANMVSFDRTAVSLLRSFLGDVDFFPVYREAPGFGAVLILAFYVMIILVGLNVFFAIIAAGISDNKANIGQLVEDERQKAVRETAQDIKFHLVGKLHAFCREIPGLRQYFSKYRTQVAPRSPASPGMLALPRSPKDDAKKRKRKGSFDSVDSRNTNALARLKITDFTTKDLCNAADQMAGRLLMRIETANVEIKVEVLRMKDSVLEMVNVTEVLARRLEVVMKEQDGFLADNRA